MDITVYQNVHEILYLSSIITLIINKSISWLHIIMIYASMHKS
jgi:hypothetical protein